MKRKILTTILIVVAMLLSVSMVSAAVSVTSSYDADSPTFGSDSTMASNPNADDESDEDIYDTATITIANTGASDLNVSSISVSAASSFSNTDDDSDGFINITMTSSTTITANGTGTATLSGRIPANLDAVDDDMEESAFKVATVTFTFSDDSTASFDAYMQRENKLEFKEVTITYGDEDEEVDDGDDIDEVKPGDNMKVDVEVENTFDEDDDDVEIEDVELLVEIDEGDLDVDEDDDIGDIGPEEEETGSVEFEIEDDADDDTYTMEISVEGEDEHGAKHGEKWEVDVEIEKKTHDIEIKSADLSENSMSCMRGENSVQVKLVNLGKKDEDEVYLYVRNSDLGLDFEKSEFEIEEGEDYSKTITFTVPNDLKAGTYNIRISAYYSGDEDDGVLADMQDLELTVSDCVSETTTVPTTTPEEVTTTPSGNVEVTVPEEVLEEFGITETEESQPFSESAGFIVLMTVLVMGALGGVVTLVFYLVKGN